MLEDWMFLSSIKKTRYLYHGDLLVTKGTTGTLLKLALMHYTDLRWFVEIVVVDECDNDSDYDDNEVGDKGGDE